MRVEGGGLQSSQSSLAQGKQHKEAQPKEGACSRMMDGFVSMSLSDALVCPVGWSHLEAHVVREAGEEMMLHMAADERVTEGPVEQGVAGQVEDTQAHQVDPLGFPISRKHGEADVLRESQVGTPQHPPPPRSFPAEQTMALAAQGHEGDSQAEPRLGVWLPT